jgi:hypothetical protein
MISRSCRGFSPTWDLLALLLCAWRAGGRRNFDLSENLAGREVALQGQTKSDADPEPKENADRMTCLRQDDLDLVRPLKPEYVIRQVIGVKEDSTNDDVYASVNDVLLKHVSLTVRLTRSKTSDKFYLYVTGDDTLKDGKKVYNNVTSVDFWLNGVDVLIRNSWMDWGSSWVADREALGNGQQGRLYLKLSAEGTASYNAVAGKYEVEITDRHTVPFKLDIENQWILEKLIKNYVATSSGGRNYINDLILDKIWEQVNKLVSGLFAAACAKLSYQEVWTEMTASVSGSQADVNSPLQLNVNAKFDLDAVPDKVLAFLLDYYDPSEVAERKMKSLLAKHNLKELWDENKDTLAAVLKRYGVDLKDYEKEFNKTKIEEDIMKATKDFSEKMIKSLEPFLEGSEGGTTAFEGLKLEGSAHTGWDPSADQGLVKAELRADEDATIPGGFFSALSGGETLAKPKDGTLDTVIGWSGLHLDDGELGIDSVELQNVRIKATANASDSKVWKLGGRVRDLGIKLPLSFQPDFKASWPGSRARLTPSGDLVIAKTSDFGDEGLTVRQIPPKAAGPVEEPKPAKARKGVDTALDGPVPPTLARPTKAAPELTLGEWIPLLTSGVSLDAEGADGRLRVHAAGTVEVSLDVGRFLKPLLAPRPSVDFGYTFYVGKFQRKLEGGEPNLPKVSQVVAVVSCGYLRLVKPRFGRVDPFGRDEKNPFEAVDWDPANGQLQMALETYTASPEVREISAGEACLVLYSSGYLPRSVSQGWISGSTKADEQLCGDKADVEQLRQAIELQVKRFRSNWAKSKEWNFGTHLHQDSEGEDLPQFLLAPGKETLPLSELIWRASDPTMVKRPDFLPDID